MTYIYGDSSQPNKSAGILSKSKFLSVTMFKFRDTPHRISYGLKRPHGMNLLVLEQLQKHDIHHSSSQIIATSHDLTPNVGLVREIPLFQGNLGWWNIIIWPDSWYLPI